MPTEPQTAEDLTFTKLPSLDTFLRGNGVPGIEYAHIASQNLMKAQQEGFEMIAGVPGYIVNNTTCLLMAKGTPIEGADPKASIPKVWFDPDIAPSEDDEPTIPDDEELEDDESFTHTITLAAEGSSSTATSTATSTSSSSTAKV